MRRWGALLGLALLLLPTAARAAATGAVDAAAGGEEKHEGATAEAGDGGHAHDSRLSDEVLPLQLEGFPQRPGFLVELGNPYLGTGRIRPGVKLPTGAIWQPTLILFGTLRTAVQSFESGDTRITEWANRLDLFANLQLSGSERLVVGVRPLDRDGRFTSYLFEPDPGEPAFDARFAGGDRFRDELDLGVEVLFFEGDFGEIFPNFDERDFRRTDLGFAIGRQPLLFQDGILIDDVIDGLGVTRNTLLPRGTSNFRATLFVGADGVDRANRRDAAAELFAVLTSTDLRRSTVDADLVYVSGDDRSGDLVAFGLSAVQRIGKMSSTFRILGSSALDAETPFATDGWLLFSEVGWTPKRSHDLVYFNAFWALDEFSSAARGAATGGPLGRAGISFAAVGLGSYGAPLSSRARDVVGGAVGYQKFFGVFKRRQLLAELGARVGTAREVADEVASTVRYQSAVGRRLVLVVDGFASRRDGPAGDDTALGGRFEVVLKF